MIEDHCEHVWGEVEEVESLIGVIHSPICRHCGAVKLEVTQRAAERQRIDFQAKEALLQGGQQRRDA